MSSTSLTRKEMGAHGKGLVLGPYSSGSTDITTPGKPIFPQCAIAGLLEDGLNR